MKKILCILTLALVGLAGFSGHNDPSLESVIAGDHRGETEKARDTFRHPKETLEFLGIKPNMTVVEIWPGGGWYTTILAPFLKNHGAYFAAGFNQSPEGRAAGYFNKATQAFKDKFIAHPETYGKITLNEFDPAAGKVDIAPEGSADMVLTFRNIHNWMGSDSVDSAFAAFFKALKPGGILGVVEHRGNPDVEQDAKAASGYVNQDHVIALAEAAGFKLAGKSKINANPNDTKDHEKGVWTLPPSYAKGDEDRAKYEAIGESDRMTLKFIKPAQ